MSITFTYKDISNPFFVPGLKKLVKSDKWKDPKQAYNVARMSTLLDSELKTFQELRRQLTKKWHAAKPVDQANPTEEETARLEELKTETDKFAEVSFVIERHKVDFEDLTGIPLTPEELLAISPILENLPD